MNALLQAVDWNNRWSYSGSLTTPPCTINVQHNVAKMVLPAKRQHIAAIKAFTENQAGAEDFYFITGGNYRVIMDITDAADAVQISD